MCTICGMLAIFILWWTCRPLDNMPLFQPQQVEAGPTQTICRLMPPKPFPLLAFESPLLQFSILLSGISDNLDKG